MLRSKAGPFLLSLTLLWGLSACSDETAPVSDPYLSGSVTDAAGLPVEGASVVAVFGVDGIELPGWQDPTKRGSTPLRFSMGEGGHLHLWVENYLRDVVRTLVDDELDAGVHQFVWDAKDDTETPVPPGLYYAIAVASVEGQEPQRAEHALLFYDFDPVDLLTRPHAVTDARGGFEIPLALFPLGEEIRVSDENGEDLGLEPISHRVHLFAIQQSEAGVIHVDRYVAIESREDPVRVEFRLP